MKIYLGHSGFILIPILIFTQLYAWLGIAALETGYLSIKSVTEQHTRRCLQNDSEYELKRIESELALGLPHCQIPPISIQLLQRQAAIWWDAHACQDYNGNVRFNYLIESLGSDTCAQPAIDYVRITLRAADKHMQVMLQSVITIKSLNSSLCEKKEYSVTLGRKNKIEI